MGKGSFVCRNSWGVNFVGMYILLFLHFWFLWYYVYVFIYGGTVSVLKHFFSFFSEWFVFCGLLAIWHGCIWIWMCHLKIWTHIWCLCSPHLKWGVYLNLHFIWKYELISDVCEHFIWHGGAISKSVHFIWKYGLISDVCGHFIWHQGVYLNLYTSSENMNWYLMSMWTSSCSLHLIPSRVYPQHLLHLKSCLSLLPLWTFKHWTIYVDCSMLLSL